MPSILAACLLIAVCTAQLLAAPTNPVPAGVDPASCPDYPTCPIGAVIASPADLPVPIINGEAVAPVLNTLPAQTLHHQQNQLVTSPADFPVPIINAQPVAPVLNTVPEQTRAHEEHLQIAQQQQLEQLKQQQWIQIQQQQQEIEAARHFGRL